MRNRYSAVQTSLLFLVLVAVGVHAQGLTIPQTLARAGKSLGSGPSVPSGLPPTLDRVLADETRSFAVL